MSEPPEATEPSDDGLVQEAASRFVLVTGAGRSGTSTVAGTLNFLGLHTPRPFLGTNKSNPRGFFESKWAIEFHRGILERAVVDTFDARPQALERIQATLRDGDGAAIQRWLTEQRVHAPQIVVKDPRSSWMPGLWAKAAADAGMSTAYVAMLRHPAEVIGSRSTYYAKGDAKGVHRYQVMSVARWVNACLITERQTRGEPRAFVRYDDLISDWRTVMVTVGADLGLVFNTDPGNGEIHRVDDFIDPTLRRHSVTWDELDVPAQLQDIAEEVWRHSVTLSETHGADEDASVALDELSARYQVLFEDSAAICRDVVAAEVKLARRKAVRDTRAKLRGDTTPVVAARRPVALRVLSRVARGVRLRTSRRGPGDAEG